MWYCVCVCIILASFHYACVCVTVLIHCVCMYVCMFSCMCECMYVSALGGYGSILLGRYWWFYLTASNQCQLTSTIRIGWITVCMGVITMVGRHFILKTCWFLKWIKFPANNKQSSVILILNDDHDLVINIHSCRSAYVQLITQIKKKIDVGTNPLLSKSSSFTSACLHSIITSPEYHERRNKMAIRCATHFHSAIKVRL